MRYLVENSPKLERVVEAVTSRLDSSVKIAPRRAAKNFLDDLENTVYNGPFKLSFNGDGKLTISSGVYSVNGDYFVAPEQIIDVSQAGYICMRVGFSGNTVSFYGYSISELPVSVNGEDSGKVPIGEVRQSDDQYELVQWYWGIPSILIAETCEESSADA